MTLQVFSNCLRSSGRTGIIASEEEDVQVAVEESYSGNYIVLFDPLDGSSNIDAAVSTGSIFEICSPNDECFADMLDSESERCVVSVCQPGSNLLADGYCMYSSSVIFVLSIGTGVLKKKMRKNRYEIENLTTWLLKHEQAGHIDAELTIVLSSISLACKQIASLLQRSSIINLTGTQGTINIQGEDQKKLDVNSNELFCNCLRSNGRTGVIASEEEDVPVAVEETYSGNYIVVFDPIDGSANIDIELTTGSIFGIYCPDEQCLVDYDNVYTLDEAKEKCIISGCQPGSNLLAAGYCLYSSSVVFTLSIGNGVFGFTLDPAYGEFVLTHEDIKIPEPGRKIYSFNEGNYDLWDDKLKKYLDHLRQPGSNGKPYSGRYIGCLVGEIHRMLLYGGIYGNPMNTNAKSGKLRLLYECAPMSYLIEQAGGKAIDGHQRILDIKPEQVHQRTPIFIGSADEIEKLEKYLA